MKDDDDEYPIDYYFACSTCGTFKSTKNNVSCPKCGKKLWSK